MQGCVSGYLKSFDAPTSSSPTCATVVLGPEIGWVNSLSLIRYPPAAASRDAPISFVNPRREVLCSAVWRIGYWVFQAGSDGVVLSEDIVMKLLVQSSLFVWVVL